MAQKISKEEKAVRDALAAVLRDTGVQKANQALGISTPTDTATKQPLGGISDIDTSTAFGKQMAKRLGQLQSYVDKTEPKIVQQYEDLGYSYDPNTGKATPEVDADTKTPAPPAPLTPPERTLASDTFRATLGLLFGATEAAKPYVTQLYGLVSNFYKTGSSVEEALNLALYQAENEKAIPEFTKRFAGLFSIRDMKQKGMAVTVPTIAEFFAAEAKMGEILTNAGLGDLATEDFLGGVIGQNKSVLEVGNLISNVFTSIDYAPTELKTTLQTFVPGVDRTAIAKAILTGKEGAQELSQKVKGISVLSAAQQQGVAMDLPTATNIAKQGYDYQQALTGFGQVKRLERIDTIAQFGGGNFTATQAQNAVFGKSIKEQMTIEELSKQEAARFQGSSGRFASKDRAAGQI
jgi:hypothetical protein